MGLTEPGSFPQPLCVMANCTAGEKPLSNAYVMKLFLLFVPFLVVGEVMGWGGSAAKSLTKHQGAGVSQEGDHRRGEEKAVLAQHTVVSEIPKLPLKVMLPYL